MNGLFSNLFGYAAPFIQDGIGVAVAAGGAWLFTLLQSKLGLNIEQSRRDALTASAKRVAGELFTEIVAGKVDVASLFAAGEGAGMHPAIAGKVAKVQAAAPDAIKALGLGGKNAAAGAGVIASKIIGELGPLLAQSGILGPAGSLVGGILGGLTAGPRATVAVR